jgi:hypothetical protein
MNGRVEGDGYDVWMGNNLNEFDTTQLNVNKTTAHYMNRIAHDWGTYSSAFDSVRILSGN